MEVQRLPRRLFYRWTPTGAEIEYPTNIPTPVPSIVCDTVQITIPPAVPGTFTLWGLPLNGSYRIVSQSYSFAQPQITTFFWSSNPTRHEVGMRVVLFNARGQLAWVNASGSAIVVDWYLTPGSTQQPRRDLLVGADRIINPTINAPCPTWRLAGGNCPPNSLDCGNCCLDCAAVNSAVNGVTSAILPYSAWRKR